MTPPLQGAPLTEERQAVWVAAIARRPDEFDAALAAYVSAAYAVDFSTGGRPAAEPPDVREAAARMLNCWDVYTREVHKRQDGKLAVSATVQDDEPAAGERPRSEPLTDKEWVDLKRAAQCLPSYAYSQFCSLLASEAQARAEVERLTHENAMLARYCFDYGNASHRCAYGYPQQRGLICGLCQHDNSDGSHCPRAALGGET